MLNLHWLADSGSFDIASALFCRRLRHLLWRILGFVCGNRRFHSLSFILWIFMCILKQRRLLCLFNISFDFSIRQLLGPVIVFADALGTKNFGAARMILFLDNWWSLLLLEILSHFMLLNFYKIIFQNGAIKIKFMWILNSDSDNLSKLIF